MRYFFECGNFSNISHAELSAVFQSYGISPDSIKRLSNSILLVESNSITKEILQRIFNKLGGFIRYGEIVEDLDSFFNPYLNGEKIVFGISVLGNSDITIKDIQKLANEIKRNLKSNGISSRFLLPKKLELNAAQIVNNNILEEGFELCIFDSSTSRLYGKTLGIQNVESFVKRDIDRPSVDFDMGVLPQKLARIMCNLTGLKEGILWDPFCGSGTVLMEATMLGFDVIGTDIDLRALESANKNIQWMAKEELIESTKYNIFHLDIHNIERRVLKDLKRTGINTVVCEPFMGPPQRKELSKMIALELLDDVKKLYISLFKALDTIASKGFKVVLIIPSYKSRDGWLTFNVSELIGKRWDVLNRQYISGDLKWGRINSIITRNIFILSKR